MTDTAEFSPFHDRDHDIGYLHFRSLAKAVEAFTRSIDRQGKRLKSEPMHDHELELLIATEN